MRTLEEEIVHCKVNSIGNDFAAEENAKLAEWLTELKEYREKSRFPSQDRAFIEKLKVEVDSRKDSIKYNSSDFFDGQREVLKRLEYIINDYLNNKSYALKYKLIGRNNIEQLDMTELAKYGIHFGDTVKVTISKDE
jgi:hypothetical protein